MKCQILFSGEKEKNISKCRLLKILPRVQSIKVGHILYVLIGARSSSTIERNYGSTKDGVGVLW